jgi:hypothetical protein
MHYEGERSQMEAWTENRLRKHGDGALIAYRIEKNLASIDGLTGLDGSLLATDETLSQERRLGL